MAKIKFKKWQNNISFEMIGDMFKIKGLKWWKTSSAHGRSKGEVLCPCCGAITEIYIWSFIGGGKRCLNCNVKLGHGGAYVYKEEITSEIKINGNEFLTPEL